MRIQHNIPSMNAYRNYNNNAGSLNRNLEKLSSGYRINRAGDDAAGLAISEKMRAQITGLDAATKNVKDGISLVKTAEGAMQEVHDMLGRMKYLATQSSNGTYQDDVDRENIQKEVNSLLDEINRIADSANFNGQKLLNGELDSASLENGFTLPGVGATLGTDTRLSEKANTKTEGTSFTVDFGDVKFDKQTSSIGTAENIKVQIGDVSVTLSADTSASWNSDVSLAEMIEAVFKNGTSSTGSLSGVNGMSNVNYSISGATYQANAAGGLKSGWYLGGTAVVGKDFSVTRADNKLTFKQGEAVDNTAGLINGDMTISVEGGTKALNVAQSMTYNNKTVNVYNAQLKTKGQLASTTLALTEDMVKVGNNIKIGNATYSFVKGTPAGTKEIQVDDLLTKYEQNKDKAAFLTAVTDRLSAAAQDNDAWSVSTSVNGVKGKPGEIMLTEKPTANVNWDFSKLENIQNSVGLVTQGKGLNLQIGDTSDAYNQMKVGVKDMHAKSLGIAGLDVSTADAANASIDKIKKAIDTVSSTRGDLGAIQNRLEHTGNNLSVMKENIQDAEATIRDTDVADEMMSYTKNNILLQSAQAMLAQANQLPQGVLQLLQ